MLSLHPARSLQVWDGLLVEALAHPMLVYKSVILGKSRGIHMTTQG